MQPSCPRGFAALPKPMGVPSRRVCQIAECARCRRYRGIFMQLLLRAVLIVLMAVALSAAVVFGIIAFTGRLAWWPSVVLCVISGVALIGYLLNRRHSQS